MPGSSIAPPQTQATLAGIVLPTLGSITAGFQDEVGLRKDTATF